MVFAIPRGKITYIGTTDTNYSGALSKPRVSEEDASNLQLMNEQEIARHPRLAKRKGRRKQTNVETMSFDQRQYLTSKQQYIVKHK